MFPILLDFEAINATSNFFLLLSNEFKFQTPLSKAISCRLQQADTKNAENTAPGILNPGD